MDMGNINCAWKSNPSALPFLLFTYHHQSCDISLGPIKNSDQWYNFLCPVPDCLDTCPIIFEDLNKLGILNLEWMKCYLFPDLLPLLLAYILKTDNIALMQMCFSPSKIPFIQTQNWRCQALCTCCQTNDAS